MKVKELMKTVHTISSNISLSEAAKIMSSRDVDTIIFMDKKKILGIMTENDMMENFSKGKTVKDVMIDKVITIDANERVEDALEIMKKRKIKHLPVVDAGELVGIVCMEDIALHSEELEEDFLID